MTVMGIKHSRPTEIKEFPQGYMARKIILRTQVQGLKWPRTSSDSGLRIQGHLAGGSGRNGNRVIRDLWVQYGLAGPRVQILWGKGHPI